MKPAALSPPTANRPSGCLVDERPPCVVHVDLDGMVDIFRAHRWDYPFTGDPIFETGLEHLLPLLDRNGIRATLFVVASSVDDPRKRELLHEAVRRGHEIASHSLTHTDLRKVDSAVDRSWPGSVSRID